MDDPEFLPTHPLRPRTANVPVSKLYLGMQVRPEALSVYARRKLLRALIRSMMQTHARLRRDGYLKPEPGDRTILMRHHKTQIREYFEVIDNAYEVEVVGVHAIGHHVGRHVVNQCYIPWTSTSSGLAYYGQLLWRAVNSKGQHVCVMQTADTLAYTFSERALLEREIKVGERV